MFPCAPKPWHFINVDHNGIASPSAISGSSPVAYRRPLPSLPSGALGRIQTSRKTEGRRGKKLEGVVVVVVGGEDSGGRRQASVK